MSATAKINDLFKKQKKETFTTTFQENTKILPLNLKLKNKTLKSRGRNNK